MGELAEARSKFRSSFSSNLATVIKPSGSSSMVVIPAARHKAVLIWCDGYGFYDKHYS